MRTTIADRDHRRQLAPESTAGRWTLAGTGLAVAGLVLLVVAFARGLESADSFTDKWWLTTWGFAILAFGLVGAVAGAVALFGRHDRSRSVPVAAVLGLLVAAVMASEALQGIS